MMNRSARVTKRASEIERCRPQVSAARSSTSSAEGIFLSREFNPCTHARTPAARTERTAAPCALTYSTSSAAAAPTGTLWFRTQVSNTVLPSRRSVLGELDLDQHGRLAGLDQPEAHQAEAVLLQYAQDQAVSRTAGLDAVDRVLQRRGEALDIGEVPQARVIAVRGHGEWELRAGQIDPDHLHRAVGDVGPALRFLRRHPVSEEDVEVAALQGCERDGDREHRGVGIIAELRQETAQERRGRGDIGPASIGEAHDATGRTLAGWDGRRAFGRHRQRP